MGLLRAITTFALLAVLIGIVTGNAIGLPRDQSEISEPQQTDVERTPDRRATWLPLENRDADEQFKELVFSALQQLAVEGRVDAGVVKAEKAEKRGRWQGFCFRRTRGGRILPYICWKGDQK